MKTYNIVKQPDGDVNLIRLEDGYTRVLKPSLLPYSALGRVYFGNGDNVALSEIVQLNGSTDDLPENMNDMIVRLNDDFFTGDGGGSATTDASALTSGTLSDSRLSNNVTLKSDLKTINGNSIVGTGDIVISSGSINTLLRNNDEIVEFGDSMTAYGNNTGNPYYDSWGFTTWLNIYTGGRLLLPPGGNKGVGGNTTVQMIARLDAALALKPKVTTVLAGTNDIAILGSPAATVQANLKIIVDAFTSVNSIVVIGTILPRYGSSALTAPQETIRQTVNAYILTLAGDKVKVVNNESVMSGAENYQSDGLHPNTLGAQKLGLNMSMPINALLPTAKITDFITQDNALTPNISLSGTTGGLNGATGQVATSYTLNASQSGGATVVGSKTSTGSYNQQVITISGNKTGTSRLIQFGAGGFAATALTAGAITNSFLDFEVLSTLNNIKGIAISSNYNGSAGYLSDSYSYFPIDAVLPVLPVGRYQLRGFNFVAPAGVTNVDMFVTIFLQDGSVAVSGSYKIWKAAITLANISPNITADQVTSGTLSDLRLSTNVAFKSDLTTKANLASPTFTGTVVLPSTTSIGSVTNTQIGYLSGVTSAVQTQLNAKAPLASPALTGTPTAPTAAAGTNTTQLATTAFVLANQGSGGGDVTQTGAQSLSNKTLVAPKIANSDFISDTNGNELVKFSGITSAVNEITVGNALTGARPYIKATGGDANIDLELGGKGTGGIMNGTKWMAQSAYYYNVKEDGKTIAGPNAVGNGTTDDTNAFQFAIYAGQGVTNKVILVPPGTYLIKGTIYLSGSNITIKGSGIGKTIIKVDGTFSGSGSIFEGNGVSDIMFEDLTVTGNGKELASAFKFNSYGDAYTQAKRFTLNRVQVVDFWGEGVLMGGSSVSPDTHNADLLSVTYCQFQRLYNPSQPIVYVDGVTKYDAIDLNQTTCRTWIVGNLIENCSGDGIYGYGQSQTVDNLDYGNWIFAFNQIKNCFMGIEINGNRLGRALKIDNNIIKFTNRIVGYCISVDSERATITNNTLYNVDRGLIEYTAVGGIIIGNTGQIVPWSSTSGGVAPTSLSNAVSFMEIYGFENLVDGNNFSYPVGRTGAGGNTPTEFRGIMLINTTTDPTDQPTSYDGISGNMAYINIKNNIISGFTHKGVDATVSRIKKVNLTNNTFRSRNSTQTVISIYGDSWNVIDNIIDMTGSTPNASNGAIGIFSSQSDNSNSIVKGNTIINTAWQILNVDRLIAFQNTFVSTASPNVSYILNQAPTITSAQRLALTGQEGMSVSQTDGDSGIYTYTGGVWVKQSSASTQLVLTGSGTGVATTISINHGLSGVTSASYVSVQPRNAASSGISYVTIDATKVNIVYTVAPATGTNNLSYSVEIKP